MALQKEQLDFAFIYPSKIRPVMKGYTKRGPRIKRTKDEKRQYINAWNKRDRQINPEKWREKDRAKLKRAQARNATYLNFKNVKRRNLGKRRKYLLDMYKCKKGCLDCGFKPLQEYSFLLEWDHRNPKDKTFNISGFGHVKALKVFFEELRKCDVVCVMCHKVRTWVTRRNDIDDKRAAGRRLVVQDLKNRADRLYSQESA